MHHQIFHFPFRKTSIFVTGWISQSVFLDHAKLSTTSRYLNVNRDGMQRRSNGSRTGERLRRKNPPVARLWQTRQTRAVDRKSKRRVSLWNETG
jgi:hypothetical protein